MQRGDEARTPLVYVPGSLGGADDFRDEMSLLAPRTTVAISPRGAGASSASEYGYTLQDRIGDLEAVLNQLQLAPACVMAFSAGVPIALSYALQRADQVRALILLDYPAVSRRLTDTWAEQVKPFAEKRGIPAHVIRAMISESTAVELWEGIERITCPVLLIVGGQSPFVTEEDVERYRKAWPQLQLEIFEESGHEVFRPNYERFMRVIERFLRAID